MMEQKKKVSFRKWWKEARPTKTAVFWSWIASIALTMIIGFAWGGWVTGNQARKIAATVAEDAVVQRLAPICVTQFNQDPARDQKLEEFIKASSYQRRTYVQEQGWATMPGEESPDRKVVDECVRLLALINP
jgi:hypothetical protein